MKAFHKQDLKDLPEELSEDLSKKHLKAFLGIFDKHPRVTLEGISRKTSERNPGITYLTICVGCFERLP